MRGAGGGTWVEAWGGGVNVLSMEEREAMAGDGA